jgi:endonuclease YncB( thermonuclease family)
LSVEVTRVVDGDTVALADGRQVRYLGLDSAEAGEPWAEEARLENLRLVEGRTADLWLAGKSAEDHYGRLLAVVYLAGSTGEGGEPACVNQRLLSRGLAWVYLVSPDALPESILARFLAAQGEAISARRGLWRNRLQAPEAEREALVSTRLRLHRRSCPEIRATATRPVSSLEEEFRKGKSPCRKCRPMDG